MGKYPFDNVSAIEYRRLITIQKYYDPGTIRHLEARGTCEGWQCLEVAAGVGSIALWLCERVGKSGRIIATDINTEFLKEHKKTNLEVWLHDIVSDDLPQSHFDLVHARLLLDLLPDRNKVLDKMVRSLKPSGWIVLEEFDSVTSIIDPSIGAENVDVFLDVQSAMRKAWKQDGFDPEYGRKLLGQLQKRGLGELGSEGRTFMRQGGSPETEPWRLSVEQLRAKFVNSGFITDEDIDKHQTLLSDPKLFYLSPLMMAVWGRRAEH